MAILKEVVPKEHKIHRHCLNDRFETVKEAFEVSSVLNSVSNRCSVFSKYVFRFYKCDNESKRDWAA